MQPEITIDLNHVAICTDLSIAFAFLLNFHPFKKKKRLVIADLATGPYKVKEQAEKFWTAGDYFTFLNALVKASKNPDELRSTMPMIDGYYDKAFRVPISTADRKNYYSRLLETYCQKELEFESIPVELCKN